MHDTGKSEPARGAGMERFMAQGAAGLLRDKTWNDFTERPHVLAELVALAAKLIGRLGRHQCAARVSARQ
jgi:hypothetical protein